MTHKEVKQLAKELVELWNEQHKPRLRANGLLTPNKTELNYYRYRAKKGAKA